MAKKDNDKDKTTSTPTTVEVDEKAVASVETTIRPFLVTRVLHAILPRRFLNVANGAAHTPTRGKGVFRVLDWVLYSSVFPIVWASALGKNLESDDFPVLAQKKRAEPKLVRFHALFAQYRTQGSAYPLARTLFSIFKWQIFQGLACASCWGLVVLSHVLLYKVLMEYFARFYDKKGSKHHQYGEGVLYILASSAVIFLAAVLQTRGIYAMTMAGSEIRTVVAAAVAQKSIHISPLARRQILSKGKKEQTDALAEKELMSDGHAIENPEEEEAEHVWTAGTVLNLVNTDTNRIQQAFMNFNRLLAAFIMLPLLMGLSYWLIDWPGIASHGLILVLLPPLVIMVRSSAKLRVRINIITDVRVTKVNDLMNGIRLLKSYAWEDIYAQSVRKIRYREAHLNHKRLFVSAIVAMCSEYMARGAPLIGVALYAAIYGIDSLKSSNVLIYTFLFFIYSIGLTLAPHAIVFAIDAWFSICRIQDYLVAEEFTLNRTEYKGGEGVGELAETSESAITLLAAEFRWIPDGKGPESDSQLSAGKQISEAKQPGDAHIVSDATTFTLQPLNLEVRSNELIAIAGPTSSGKSSLAAALACRMPLIRGTAVRKSMPVYAPSSPWIRSATVRDNILFYRPFNAACYNTAITACGLRQDLENFNYGDQEVLGERGITLSGGQKARVGLARALYEAILPSPESPHTSTSDNEQQSGNARIVVLDDPFAALDAVVGATVFDEAILESMSKMTRVLVTHQTHLLSRCQRIIWMEKGRVQAIGTYDELMEREDAFRMFVGEQLHLEHEQKDGPAGTHFNHEDTSTAPVGKEIMLVEERRQHGIPWKIYASYFNLPRMWWYVIFVVMVYAVSQVGNCIWTLAFAWWTGQEYGLGTREWVGVICGIFVVHILTWMGTYLGVQRSMTSCSRDAGTRALEGVLRAPIAFFDTTPIGRIINRFTQVSKMCFSTWLFRGLLRHANDCCEGWHRISRSFA